MMRSSPCSSAQSSAFGPQSTGKERDAATGLDYFGARYLSAAQGRFTSADNGVDQHPADPQSWNLYAYVGNNPLRFVDKNGRVKKDANGNVVFDKVANGTVNYTEQAIEWTLPNGAPGTMFASWKSDVGFIYADDGTPIVAGKATSDISVTLRDAKGEIYQQGGASLLGDGWSNKTNCVGTAFADGQVWISTDQVPKLVTGDNYKTTSTPSTGNIGLYTKDGTVDSTQHAVTVSSTDEKGNVNQVVSKGGITPSANKKPGPGPNSAWSNNSSVLIYLKQEKKE
jgi:RHS repeat-associated protein